MDTLIIEKKNEVYITVDCDPNIQREISEFFTFYVPGYKFMPAFRNRMWDGKIRLFSQKTKEIYFGLFPYIKAFAEERGYYIVPGKDVDIDNKVDKDVVGKNRDILMKFINDLNSICDFTKKTSDVFRIETKDTVVVSMLKKIESKEAKVRGDAYDKITLRDLAA